MASYNSMAAISQNNELKRTPMSINERFTKMCDSYIKMKRNGREGQYAVAWIGDGDYSPGQRVDLSSGNDDDDAPYYYEAKDTVAADKDKYYIVSAVGSPDNRQGNPQTHSEALIFGKIDEQIKRYKNKNNGKDPEVFLFTMLSPCCTDDKDNIPVEETCRTGCSEKIRKWASEAENRKITVAWNEKFGKERAQLFSIYNIQKANDAKIRAKINWNHVGEKLQPYCRSENSKEWIWFQKKVFDCLLRKAVIPADVCSSRDIFKKDLAKFVNRIAWECASIAPTQAPTQGPTPVPTKSPEGAAKNEEPNYGNDATLSEECWRNHGIKYIGNKAHTMRKLLKGCALGKRSVLMMGPAVDPENTDGSSNKASDIKEEATKFCFTA
eukprot:Seg2595.2 transcript_id=Seg2595.2/GoldUCD/mRNA.D3Y31 product="hypothetical protein" protein_id=Seg2595.2/GoldUCD/D3Y31